MTEQPETELFPQLNRIPERMRPGPKPDPERAAARAQMPYLSDRAFSRYWVAWLKLMNARPYKEDVRKLMDVARTRQGRLNIVKFGQLVDDFAEWSAAGRPDRSEGAS